VRKPEGKRPVGRLDVGRKIILKWILERYDGVVRTGFIWLKMETSEGLLLTRER
jgi:hypothetical protein